MYVVYYIAGAVLTVLLTILYEVFRVGSIVLNQTTLIDLSVRALIAVVAFVITDFLISKRKQGTR